MKKILIILLSITLGYSSFATSPNDKGTDLYKCISPTEIQLYDQINDLLKTSPLQVFLYIEQKDEFFRLDKDTGSAYKSSKEEYQKNKSALLVTMSEVDCATIDDH